MSVSHVIAAVVLGTMWVIFLLTWTIPSFRRREPHEVLVSFGFASFVSLAVLVYWGVWQAPRNSTLVIAALPLQVVALLLIVGSFSSLRSKGQPVDTWEQTTVLVESGVYRIARHPMYLGTALWAAGMALATPDLRIALLAAAVVALAFAASITEDRYNVRKFGKAYADYMQRVPLTNLPGMRKKR